MKVKPYILYGQSTMEAVHTRLSDCLFSWRREWGLPEETTLSDVESGAGAEFKRKLADGSGLFLGVAGNNELWVLFFLAEPVLGCLGAMLLNDRKSGSGYGGVTPSEIQNELAKCCLGDLAMEIMKQKEHGDLVINRLLPPLNEHSIYKELRPGAGAVNFRISFGNDLEVDACASPAVAVKNDGHVSFESGGEGMLHSRQEALGGEKVQAKVVLNDIELTLDALGSISVGDVILLDQSIDEPCVVMFERSELRCKGFLGKKNEKLAVKVDSLMK